MRKLKRRGGKTDYRTDETTGKRLRKRETISGRLPQKRMTMAKTTEIKLRVIELRAEGLSYAKIAEACNIAKQTAVDIVNENIDDVNNLQAFQVEALFKEKQIDAEGRIEQLTALQARLKEEIEKRDLSDIPTDKLITLYAKLTEQIRSETWTPKFESTEEQEEAKADREASLKTRRRNRELFSF